MSIAKHIREHAILGIGVSGESTSYPSNRGSRTLGGRISSFNNGTQQSFQLTSTIETEAVGIRPVLASNNGAYSGLLLNCKMSALASIADPNNSAGTWVQATCADLIPITIEIAPTVSGFSYNRLAYTLPDYIRLPSVARSDGGLFPLYSCRAYFAADSALPVLGNGADNFTNWATRPDGRSFIMRKVAGDAVTTPSAWNSGLSGYATNISQCPIIGFDYLAKGRVDTVGRVGDSIIEGRATYLQEDYIQTALNQLSTSNHPIESSNFGWSSSPSTGTLGFMQRALDILNSPLKPKLLAFEMGSCNDSTPITQSVVNDWKYNTSVLIAACKEVGVIPLPITIMATSYAGHSNGSSDSLRLAFNAEMITAFTNSGITYFDSATPVAGLTEGHGQQEMNLLYTDDGVHPNTAGNNLLGGLIKPIIASLLGV